MTKTLKAIDNRGGGDCAIYAFAIGEIDVIQKQLANANDPSSEILTILQKRIAELDQDNTGFFTAERKKELKLFEQKLLENITHCTIDKPEKDFLNEFQLVLRYILRNQQLAEINHLYNDRLALIVNVGTERSLYVDCTNNFDANYTSIFQPLIEIFNSRLEQERDFSLSKNNNQGTLNVLKNIYQNDNNDDAATAVTEIIDCLTKVTESNKDYNKEAGVLAECAVIVSHLKENKDFTDDQSQEQLKKALPVFQSIFEDFLEAARQKDKTEQKTWFKDHLLILGLDIKTQIFSDVINVFMSHYAPENNSVRLNSTDITQTNVARDANIQSKCKELAKTILNFEKENNRRLTEKELHRCLRYFLFEQPSTAEIKLNKQIADKLFLMEGTGTKNQENANIPKFDQNSAIAILINDLCQSGVWGTTSDLNKLAEAFDNHLFVEIYKNGQRFPQKRTAGIPIIKLSNRNNIHWITYIDTSAENNDKEAILTIEPPTIKKEPIIAPLMLNNAAPIISEKKLKHSLNRLDVLQRNEKLQSEKLIGLNSAFESALGFLADFITDNQHVLSGKNFNFVDLIVIDRIINPRTQTSEINPSKYNNERYKTLTERDLASINGIKATMCAFHETLKVKNSQIKPPSRWLKLLSFFGFKSARNKIQEYERVTQQTSALGFALDSLGDYISKYKKLKETQDKVKQTKKDIEQIKAEIKAISENSANKATNEKRSLSLTSSLNTITQDLSSFNDSSSFKRRNSL